MNKGVPPSGSGHSGQAPESASGLGHSASVPNADDYTTIVVRHKDTEAARAFIKTAHATWPFMDENAPSRMTFVSVGDAASVAEAMRMALECDELIGSERQELALDLHAHCFTWDECLAYAASEWELAHAGGKFVDAQGTDARSGETACGLDPKGDGPVGNADAPITQSHPVNKDSSNDG